VPTPPILRREDERQVSLPIIFMGQFDRPFPFLPVKQTWWLSGTVGEYCKGETWSQENGSEYLKPRRAFVPSKILDSIW
jgi:hypothetical protein